ncbi:threonine ammonia-lyase [Streptomyces chartreusis]
MRTPLRTDAAVDALVGRRVLLKAEDQQHTGSYKLRGAFVALAAASSAQRAAGVVTASSGNHARGLVHAARLHKISATVVLPADAPRVHRGAIKAIDHRTKVIHYDQKEAWPDALAQEIAYRDRLTLIPAANHASVIAGAGTVALEMLEEAPDLAAILVPIGGGALAAGTVLAARQLKSRVKVIGVEPGAAADTHASVRTGRRIQIKRPAATIADGLRQTEPAPIPFDIIRQGLADIILVSDRDIAEAMALLWSHYGITAEPSGAVAFAGLMRFAAQLPRGRLGVVVSGRNVDWTTFGALTGGSLTRLDSTANFAPQTAEPAKLPACGGPAAPEAS